MTRQAIIRRAVTPQFFRCGREQCPHHGFRAGDVRSGNALAHGEADADARTDRPNATGEPRPRTIVEEQVLRHDTEIEP